MIKKPAVSSVPAYVSELFEKKFNAKQLALLDANWEDYSNGISFGNSSASQLVAEAKMVLACVREDAAMEKAQRVALFGKKGELL